MNPEMQARVRLQGYSTRSDHQRTAELETDTPSTVDITGNLAIKRSDATRPGPGDRRRVHAFVILSVSFDISRETPPAPGTNLDITLVQPKAKTKPAEKPGLSSPNRARKAAARRRSRSARPARWATRRRSPRPNRHVELERRRRGNTATSVPEIIAATKAPRRRGVHRRRNRPCRRNHAQAQPAARQHTAGDRPAHR